MSTKELRARYESALRSELEGAGLVRRRGEYVWPLPCDAGQAALVIGVAAKFGRLTTLVNVVVTSAPFEALVSEVIGQQLHQGLRDGTLFLGAKELNGPPRPKDVRWREVWPAERAQLDIEDPTDVADAVEIVVSVWRTFLRPYVETLDSLAQVAQEHRFMDPGRQPLALHLLGLDEELSDALDELALQPHGDDLALLRAYRANLPCVARLSA